MQLFPHFEHGILFQNISSRKLFETIDQAEFVTVPIPQDIL
jgi:hypothetical protein